MLNSLSVERGGILKSFSSQFQRIGIICYEERSKGAGVFMIGIWVSLLYGANSILLYIYFAYQCQRFRLIRYSSKQIEKYKLCIYLVSNLCFVGEIKYSLRQLPFSAALASQYLGQVSTESRNIKPVYLYILL